MEVDAHLQLLDRELSADTNVRVLKDLQVGWYEQGALLPLHCCRTCHQHPVYCVESSSRNPRRRPPDWFRAERAAGAGTCVRMNPHTLQSEAQEA